MTEVVGVLKADDAQQNIYGFASVAVAKDGADIVDGEGDIVPIAELEHAAYEFVKEAGGSGEDHNGEPVDGVLIESMVFTPEKLNALGLAKSAVPGAWWIGIHIPDRAAYERAKTNRRAFSIEGSAVREPA